MIRIARPLARAGLAATIGLVSGCLEAHEQRAETAEYALPDASRLTLMPDTTVLLRQDGREEQVVGRAIQTFVRDTLAGRPVILQVYSVILDDAAPLVDSLWLEDPSLLALRHRRESAWSTIVLEYSGTAVRGSAGTDGRPAQSIDVKLAAPSYDAAAADLVVRALDLRPGLRVTLPIFTAGLGPGTLEVRRVEDVVVRTPAGVDVAAWEVGIQQDGVASTLVFAQDTQELLEARGRDGRALFRSTRGRRVQASRPTA